GDRFFYMTYFQQVGPPEAELEADVERSLRLVYWSGSAATFAPQPDLPDRLPAAGTGVLEGFTSHLSIPDGLPGWLPAADMAHYVDQFEASGFFGPLGWYRNLDADWELTRERPAPPMPTAFIGGNRDMVIATRWEYVESMRTSLPDFRGVWTIENAGHWTQQEAPDAFNAALREALEAVTS
ncbi:MAG: alpha/beta hydrolase, partial [Actinomycetota bacterium]